ncbi:MAG: signal peptidase II [Sphingorhabdus sp.]
MGNRKSYRLFGILLAALIFSVDQLVKYVMTGPLALESRSVIHIMPFFDFRWTENHGISLGMLTADNDTQRWLLVGFTAFVAIIVTIWMLREKLLGDVLALAMVLGGALGNIVDRARLGYVLDYADLHFGTFRPFLIFNVADACITIGVLILLARAFMMREKDTNSDEGEQGPSAEKNNLETENA